MLGAEVVFVVLAGLLCSDCRRGVMACYLPDGRWRDRVLCGLERLLRLVCCNPRHRWSHENAAGVTLSQLRISSVCLQARGSNDAANQGWHEEFTAGMPQLHLQRYSAGVAGRQSSKRRVCQAGLAQTVGDVKTGRAMIYVITALRESNLARVRNASAAAAGVSASQRKQ